MGLDNRLLSSAAVNINRKDLFISGGYSFQGLLDSTEVHTIENAPKLGPNLPFATSDHCMVQFKSTKFMLIGFDRNLRKNRYFIYDLSTHKWQPEIQGSFLPQGGTTQQYCTAFKTEGRTKIFLSGYAFNSYIYDVSSNKWTQGRLSILRKKF